MKKMKLSKHRKMREAITAVLTLVLLLTSIGSVLADDGAVTANMNVETKELGNFKDDFNYWKFENGPEFPGAVGSFQQVQGTDLNIGTDGYIAKLMGNFTNGGLYVAARRSFDPLDIKELDLRVKTEDTSFVRLRMTDSTGQVHQQKLALTANGQYEDIAVNVFNDGIDYSHWNGANDGIWHAPAKGIVLILERKDLIGGKKIGQIEISDVSAFVPMPRLGLNQTKLGNIFMQGEQPIIEAVTAGDEIVWRALNFGGNQVAEGTISTPDGTASMAIPVTANGYYSLQVTALQNGAQLATAETSFAMLEPFDINQFDDSPFGLATHFGQTWNTELISLISKLGAKTIRDEIYWKDVEKTQGQYEFPAKYNAYMNVIEQSGIKPFIVLSYGNPLYDEGKKPNTDAGHNGFANYGNSILDQYPTLVDAVEVYNEFNHGLGELNNGRHYLPLLKATYEKLKSQHSTVTVVGPATAGAPTAWIEELFQLGGLQYLDAISIHPYRYPLSPEDGLVGDLNRVQNLIKKYNNQQTKPIWLSELGWPSHQGSEGVSEQVQATYLTKSYVLALANGVEKYFWYDFMDDGILNTEREQNFGIVRNATSPYGKYVPKPSYVAYGVMARQLSVAKFEQKETIHDSINSFLFSDHNKDMRVMWSSEPTLITLKTSTPIIVTDMMGVAQSFAPDQNNTIYLSLSEQPIYVRGELTEIAAGSQFILSDGEAVIGEPVIMKLTVNNTAPAAKPIDAELKIGELNYPVKTAAGVCEEISITLPPQQEAGIWPVAAELMMNGEVIGRLDAQMHIKWPFTLQARHQWDEKQNTEFLRVTISNQSGAPQSVDSLEWSIGASNGTEQLEKSVPGRSSIEVFLPLSELDGPKTYDLELKLHAQRNEILSYNGKVVIPDKTAVNEMPKQTIKIDGTLDEIADIPVIDIMKEGNNRLSPYNGEADLSGQAWLSWDKQNLYFSARIQDDIFSQKAVGDQIWEGDSIQIALAAGYPGERQERFEYGIALTPEGPQIYNWYAHGRSPGVQNGQLVVKRDDDKQQTVYELAMPWEEISPIDPVDGLFSFSFLVNDNDGQGRKGYVEWGSGIGTAKNPALFKPVRLTGAENEPSAVMTPSEPDGLNGWYTVPVTMALSTSGKAEYSLNGGAAWHSYTSPIVLDQDGVHMINYRSTNDAGMIGAIQTVTVNIDRTAPADAIFAADITAPTNADVTLTISYPDDAAVKEFKVGANGTWTTYVAPVVVSANDTVYARGMDAAGNVSNVTNYVVSNINKINPVTVAKLSPAAPNGSNSWYTTDVSISLSVSADVYGGGTSTEYQVNDGAWIAYTGSIPAFGEGTYKFGYRSKDQAGNIEQLKTIEFKVDKTAPSLFVHLDKTSIWPANHKMVTIHATLNSSDDTSGVESVVLNSITINQSDSGQGDIEANLGTAATSFSLRAEKGRTYTITYTATDKAGNKTVSSATVTVPHDQSGNH
jgi:hypothetical protein